MVNVGNYFLSFPVSKKNRYNTI